MKVYEKDLQRAVAKYLNGLESHGRLAWNHPPNGFNANWKEWNRMKACGAKPGQPDCEIFLKGGKTIFVELKTLTGKLSKSQASRNQLLAELGFDTHMICTDCPVEAVNKVERIIIEAGAA